MGETSDGQAGPSAALPEDADPDSPARSFFSRIFGRDSSDDGPPGGAASGGRARGPRLTLRNLRRLRVDDVSVPRADIVAIPEDAPLADVVAVFQESELSRLPVYSETLDQPLGLVHLKDLALKHGFGARSLRWTRPSGWSRVSE